MATKEKDPPVDISKVKKLPKDFAGMVKEYAEIVSMQGTLEKRRKELSGILAPAQIVSKSDRILVGDLVSTIAKGSHVNISGRKLLEHGVASDVIVACTDRSEYVYVVVSKYNPDKEK